jgi:hypothetical protein
MSQYTRVPFRETVFALLVGMLGAAAATASTQAEVDVSGTWLFQVETSAGSGAPTITLKQEGEKLSGTYEGQLGRADLTGTLKARAILFTFTVDAQGQSVEVTYQGTVDSAGSMNGSVDIAGGAVSGTFTAKRK